MKPFKNFYAQYGYRVMEVMLVVMLLLIALIIYNAEMQRDINKKLQQNQEEVLKLLKR